MKGNRGFTLIELMIVVAIISVLAAIAVPAYQSYTLRAKISESVIFLKDMKTDLYESWATNGAYPAAVRDVPKDAFVDSDSEYIENKHYNYNGSASDGDKVWIAVALEETLIDAPHRGMRSIHMGAKVVDGELVFFCGIWGGSSSIDTGALPPGCDTINVNAELNAL
ncbi:prepilin-type N-terminal cleavage/methylation domain-containing protein [Parendozoicomonas sp. Alg238-R29]|uniref:type IV pilin protein n=1 Tax=Parendozoicomonas sp. Alg238-R29 TaxID=2993446 RepID=UPI00248F24A0|nr:prepilin-type N-terminal cleavage/methylation domain-containing protein [Parendozoicomonas sp. Alg238-R29]